MSCDTLSLSLVSYLSAYLPPSRNLRGWRIWKPAAPHPAKASIYWSFLAICITIFNPLLQPCFTQYENQVIEKWWSTKAALHGLESPSPAGSDLADHCLGILTHTHTLPHKSRREDKDFIGGIPRRQVKGGEIQQGKKENWLGFCTINGSRAGSLLLGTLVHISAASTKGKYKCCKTPLFKRRPWGGLSNRVTSGSSPWSLTISWLKSNLFFAFGFAYGAEDAIPCTKMKKL